MKKNFEKIPADLDEIAGKIVDEAYTVHNNLGPGLLERVYEICFSHELAKRKLSYQKQVGIPIKYDDLIFDEAFRIDVLVEDRIICELKSVDEMIPIYKAQILSYLKLTGKKLGFLINFNVPIIKQGLKRLII